MPDRPDHLAERELYALARNARFIFELEVIWKEVDRRRVLGQNAR
jgi:hypothetical protein